LGDTLDSARKLVGEELAARIKPVWALNEEKEPCGVWRSDTGVDNLWYALGKYLWESYLDICLTTFVQELSRCVDSILDI
jgi:hypothetical protein